MNFNNHFATLARYHLWAVCKLYEHVDALSDGDYRRDAGLFFKSVHGTLNHLLVGEHAVWFPRFAQGVSNRVALNTELEPERDRLRERLIEGARGRARARRRASGSATRLGQTAAATVHVR